MSFKNYFLALSLFCGFQNLNSSEINDQQSLEAILYAEPYVTQGYAADFIFSVTEVYQDDESFNPGTLIFLDDGSRWEAHPHYQYGPGPSHGMKVGIIPMSPDEIPDFTWIHAHPCWLVLSYGNQQEFRFPVRRL